MADRGYVPSRRRSGFFPSRRGTGWRRIYNNRRRAFDRAASRQRGHVREFRRRFSRGRRTPVNREIEAIGKWGYRGARRRIRVYRPPRVRYPRVNAPPFRRWNRRAKNRYRRSRAYRATDWWVKKAPWRRYR